MKAVLIILIILISSCDKSIDQAEKKTVNYPVKVEVFKVMTSEAETNLSYSGTVTETTSMMLSQIVKLTLEQNPPDLHIKISRRACRIFDFHRSAELVDLGKKVVRKSSLIT